MKIIISEEAHKDLEDIFKYIAKDSLKYAKITIDNIYNRIYNLSEFPYIGSYVRYTNNKMCREIIYKSYKIIYTISTEKREINVHFIIHKSRNFKSIFSKYQF